jgi:pyruvate kinase
MIRAGMDVARLNFSHGTHQTHAKVFQRLRSLSKTLDTPMAIIQDLQGIKIRITDVETPFKLSKGKEVFIRPGREMTSPENIFIDYPALLKDVKKGHRILIDDGLITLLVKKRVRGGLIAVVKEGGTISSRKGVNLPDSSISLSPFTDKDKNDLSFGLQLGVDYVAISFVTSYREVKALKSWMEERGHDVPVIAKIERPEAVADIDRIVDVADGIMVARGDLGVEMPPEEVPLIQKELIRKANEEGKIVITATQMLESMRHHTRPTRAEATDVANAVIDGSDALMLSAETSTGQHPVKAIRMMKRIIRTTEEDIILKKNIADRSFQIHKENKVSFAVADAAVRAAEDVKARYIVALTKSGYTARLASKLRPKVPIIAFSPDEPVVRRMSLYWGVIPFMMERLQTAAEMLQRAVEILIEKRLLKRGDTVVIIGGDPPGQGMTNMLKILTIGN